MWTKLRQREREKWKIIECNIYIHRTCFHPMSQKLLWGGRKIEREKIERDRQRKEERKKDEEEENMREVKRGRERLR